MDQQEQEEKEEKEQDTEKEKEEEAQERKKEDPEEELPEYLNVEKHISEEDIFLLPEYLNVEKHISEEDIFPKEILEYAKNLMIIDVPILDLDKKKNKNKKKGEPTKSEIETPTAVSVLLNNAYKYFHIIYDVIIPPDQNTFEQCQRSGGSDNHTDKYTPKKKIPMIDFLNACDFIYLLFTKIPPRRNRLDAFKVAQEDMLQNILRLKQQYTIHKTTGFTYVHDSPLYDHLAILWLNRSLEFVAELLKLVTNSGLTLSGCAKKAYQTTLKQHHNNFMAVIAECALKFTPNKKDFLLAVSDGLYSEEEMFELEKSREGTATTESATESELVMTILCLLSTNIKEICEYNNDFLRTSRQYC